MYHTLIMIKVKNCRFSKYVWKHLFIFSVTCCFTVFFFKPDNLHRSSRHSVNVLPLPVEGFILLSHRQLTEFPWRTCTITESMKFNWWKQDYHVLGPDLLRGPNSLLTSYSDDGNINDFTKVTLKLHWETKCRIWPTEFKSMISHESRL